jgi:hypothetical protein
MPAPSGPIHVTGQANDSFLAYVIFVGSLITTEMKPRASGQG